MSEYDVINRALAESQQNVIDLTNPDLDAQPLDLSMSQTIKVKTTIKVERQNIAGDSLIWGNEEYGEWGTQKWSEAPGFILGNDDYGILGTSKLGSNLPAWETLEEITSDGLNQTGLDLLIDNTKDEWTYLAYGSGVVADNDSSLADEVGRLTSPTINVTGAYFESQFIMDESTGNGNLIQEIGLANASSGDISSTDLTYPVDKNITLYVPYHIKTYIANF